MANDRSIFDTPGLDARMSSRRRLPHPTMSDMSPTLEGHLFEPFPHIVSFEDFLGSLEGEETPTINRIHNAHGFPGERYPFADPTLWGPGPSTMFEGAFPAAPIPSDVIYESGWIKDVFGKEFYVGHGKIEELQEHDGNEAHNADNALEEEEYNNQPRAQPLTPTITDNGSFYVEPIPLNSTPPPPPRPRKLPSLKATTTYSEYQFLANSNAPSIPPAMPATTANASPSMIGLDNLAEVALVKENMDLLMLCTEHIQFMNTYFLAHLDDLSQHIDVCYRIEESLKSLTDIITYRSKMGAEEWNVRSPIWHQKYSKRLLSLRITLNRLAHLRQVIENHKPQLSSQQAHAILSKLEQHEAKLADLASKYTASFDRLRLRHLHFLLSQSHDEAKRQKEQKLRSRASFERQWKAGKDLRAGLRHAFDDLRQDFYNYTQRVPRHPAAP